MELLFLIIGQVRKVWKVISKFEYRGYLINNSSKKLIINLNSFHSIVKNIMKTSRSILINH